MVFNNSRGTWQTLMHWKRIFDRCYCINSTTMLKNNKNLPGTIFDLIAITLLISTRTIHFYKNPRFRPWSSIEIFFQPLADFHKFTSFPLTFSFKVVCSVIFLQYPNLHNSCVICFIDSFNCKLTLLLYRRSTALTLAYENSKTYALMACEIPC